MYWCEKKGMWLTDKKANKKCIKTNIKKRGVRCPNLMDEDTAILFSVKMRR